MEHIFVTGGTGVLGSAIVPLLLQDPEVHVHLLVRADDPRHLQERFSELRHFWADEVTDSQSERIHLYRGDAAQDHFGLQDTDINHLESTITHIIHSAAAVKLDMTVSEAATQVYAPARQVLDFALRIHAAGRLQKYEYVSTLGVSGRTPGAIPEEPLGDLHGFHNEYERTKFKAENEVISALKDQDLPVTIHRPSMIIGRRTDGKIPNFQGFYFLCRFLTGRQTGGILPSSDQTFDLVPVDYVAQGIVQSLREGIGTKGRIFHLSAGPQKSIGYKDLNRYLHFYALQRGKPLPRTYFMPPILFLAFLNTWAMVSSNARLKKSARALGLYYKHLKTIQQFTNDKTTEHFDPLGITLPPAEDYLGTVLDYWVDHAKHAF